MGTIEANPASGALPASHVPVDCFGERGMDHCPDRPHHLPIAAGLFGLPARYAPPSGGAGGHRRMRSAA